MEDVHFLVPYSSESPQPISITFETDDYIGDVIPHAKCTFSRGTSPYRWICHPWCLVLPFLLDEQLSVYLKTVLTSKVYLIWISKTSHRWCVNLKGKIDDVRPSLVWIIQCYCRRSCVGLRASCVQSARRRYQSLIHLTPGANTTLATIRGVHSWEAL